MNGVQHNISIDISSSSTCLPSRPPLPRGLLLLWSSSSSRVHCIDILTHFSFTWIVLQLFLWCKNERVLSVIKFSSQSNFAFDSQVICCQQRDLTKRAIKWNVLNRMANQVDDDDPEYPLQQQQQQLLYKNNRHTCQHSSSLFLFVSQSQLPLFNWEILDDEGVDSLPFQV